MFKHKMMSLHRWGSIVLVYCQLVGAFVSQHGCSSRGANVLGVSEAQDDMEKPYSVVVVGGGWAGFSAADAISASKDVQVRLLDASPLVVLREGGEHPS